MIRYAVLLAHWVSGLYFDGLYFEGLYFPDFTSNGLYFDGLYFDGLYFESNSLPTLLT